MYLKLLVRKLYHSLVLTLGLVGAITSQASAQKLPLSTNSDSALYYYYLGWKEVMDHGHYSNSALAYRKMAQSDPEFLIGQCLLARISEDPEERLRILTHVENHKASVDGDERLLLDVFIELIKLTNLRASKDTVRINKQLQTALKLGEVNLKRLAYKYVDDIYYRCEYIEVMAYLYGPDTALATLRDLFPSGIDSNSFLLGFSSGLESKMQNLTAAKRKAQQLSNLLSDIDVPRPWVTWAQYYKASGQTDSASYCVDKALELDAGCLDAIRLKQEINR